MNDSKSTNEIRLIAQQVIEQQLEVCDAQRTNLADRIERNSRQISQNAVILSQVTVNVATLTANEASMASAISSMTEGNVHRAKRINALENAVTRLKVRPAIYSAIGAAIGAVGPKLIDLFVKWING